MSTTRAAHGAAVRGWWREYFAGEGEEPSWIHVDLSLGDHAPVSGLPILSCITVPLSAPTWRVAPEESAAFARVAAELERASAPPVGHHRGSAHHALRFVGWRSRAGRAELYLYGERTLDRRHLAEAARHLPGAALRCHDREDSRWRVYLDSLHPGLALEPLLLTAAQLDERRRGGDDQAVRRAVDHLIRFRDARGRHKFVERLHALRTDWELRPFEAGGERRFGLECTTEHTLDRWVIDPRVIALSTHAHEHGGVYEGWGAPRVKHKGSS